MTRYQLAKLVEWAGGTLRSRKRLQKVVFLLQSAGCPLCADFGLHHFGPYSQDVAQRTDEMTTLGLLKEENLGNTVGQQYNYSLTEEAAARLANLEASPRGRAWADEMAPHEARAKELLGKEVRELEVAATIAFFHLQNLEWADAVKRTCDFKALKPDDSLVHRAEALARSVVP